MADFLVHATIIVSIFVVVALSLNLQYGMAGLLNFGQIWFFAIGAYVAAINLQHFDLPVWVEVIAALIAGGLAGWLIALFTRRLKQDYWALATLAAAEIFRLLMQSESWLAGGAIGTLGIPKLADPLVYLFVTVGLVLVAFGINEHIRRSAFGRVIRMMREDETLTAAFGRDVFRFQMQVMIIGGAMAALPGVIYAHYVTFINPDAFQTIETFLIWTMVILGGRGNNVGVIAGAVVLETISVSTRFIAGWSNLSPLVLANLRVLIYGVGLVLLVLFRQQGLFPEPKNVFPLEGDKPAVPPADESRAIAASSELQAH